MLRVGSPSHAVPSNAQPGSDQKTLPTAGKDDALQKRPGITEQSGKNVNKREGAPLADSNKRQNKRPKWANPPRKLDDLPEELISQILDGIPHGKKVTSLARTSQALYRTALTPTKQKVKASKVQEMADRIRDESPPELRHILFAILVDYVKDPAIPLIGANLIYAFTALASALNSLPHEHTNNAFNTVLDLVRNTTDEGVRAEGIACLAWALDYLETPWEEGSDETDEEYLARWKNVSDGYENLITLTTELPGDTAKAHAAIALTKSLSILDVASGNPGRFVKVAGIFASLNDDKLKLEGVHTLLGQFSSIEIRDSDTDTQEKDRIARDNALNSVLDIAISIKDDEINVLARKAIAKKCVDIAKEAFRFSQFSQAPGPA